MNLTFHSQVLNLQQCGVGGVYYELQYFQPLDLTSSPPITTVQTSTSDEEDPGSANSSTSANISFSLGGLKPFTQYSVSVRALVSLSLEGGAGGKQNLVSGFSEPLLFTTHQAGMQT